VAVLTLHWRAGWLNWPAPIGGSRLVWLHKAEGDVDGKPRESCRIKECTDGQPRGRTPCWDRYSSQGISILIQNRRRTFAHKYPPAGEG